jgi:2-keto-3-deoxy-L-rhamnonate aldolase RhmA
MATMVENRVKAKLKAGGFAFGTGVALTRTPALMRLIAGAGYDFVFIDMEHSSFSFETINDMCDMARSVGLAPIVRPYSHDPALGNRILDIGAMGLMYFDVDSREQVDGFVRAMRFPPAGARQNSRGSAFDYLPIRGRESYRFVDENTMLVIQLETLEAIENIDRILEGGGVDVVEIGRSDLSIVLGVAGQREHPRVLEVVDRAIAACRRHNVAAGCGSDSLEDAQSMIGRGVRYLFYGTNDLSILGRAYRQGHEALISFAEAQARKTKGGA